MGKQTKVVTRRKKFVDIEIPLLKQKVESVGSLKEVEGRTIKLDLTKQLKGKSVEAIFKIKIENEKAIAYPKKIRLMPYFIRRIMRKRISYVEDSFEAPSQGSILKVKPFLITRKKVSRAVRKTLRNKARNWLEDYVAEKKDNEIFKDILNNKIQRPLALVLKKTYPLSFCEIRVLEILRPLNEEEISEVKKKKKGLKKEIEKTLKKIEKIEKEKVKKAEEKIKKAQAKAAEKEKSEKSSEK